MNFDWVTINDRTAVDAYMLKYGEGSCQHSFMAMYGMKGKYGDKFCIDNDVLYVLRTGLSYDERTAFLVPMGESCLSDAELKAAVEKCLNEAHARGTKLDFNTLTEKSMTAITALFPGKFSVEEARDSFEYMHYFEDLLELKGPKYARRRQDINSFFRTYGDRTDIKVIEESDMKDLTDFQKRWNDEFRELCIKNGKKIIDHEHEGIMNTFEHFFELPVSGIVLRIDGRIRGYAYGTVISEDVYDVLVEKGDRQIKDIYRPLNRELVRECAAGHRLINREEDCGDPGLRASKMSLEPAFLCKKEIL